ncbi:hypothetical protein GF337_09700 [candidate division KSB1 bacterium]|nr:hypothetical protein [candidate division KSB1 bacterium]
MKRFVCIVLLLAGLPFCLYANYTHILFYHASEKYILLNAFPIDYPEKCQGILFSNDDWHYYRYRNSEELHQFLDALGFADEEARIKFKAVFQKNPPRNDDFRAVNWSNLFNWLSDMRIEEVHGNTILLKELSDVDYDYLQNLYETGNYFPTIENLEQFLPRLIMEVEGIPTNVLDFGLVGMHQKKSIKVVLRAEYINNALLTINPIRQENLDNSISLDKSDRSIFISEYKSDTLTFSFSPGDENTTTFWNKDTLTFVTTLNGDYLPKPENLIINGIRDRSLSANIPWKLIGLIGSAVLGVLLLILLRKVFAKIFRAIFINGIFRIFKRKKVELEKEPQPPIEDMETAEITPQKPVSYSEETEIKTPHVSKEEKLFKILQRFYHEYAEYSLYKEAFNKIFGPVHSNRTEILKLVEQINADRGENVKEDENLLWYKEAFEELKQSNGIAKMEDMDAKIYLSKKQNTVDYKKMYDIIQEYCYKPVLSEPHLFLNKNEAITKNLDVFQKNKERLIDIQLQLREFATYQQEINEFINDVSSGNLVNIKESIGLDGNSKNGSDADDEDNVIDFENFLKIKNLFDGVTEAFYKFLKELRTHLSDLDGLSISAHWKEIVKNIIQGRSGLAGINGCLARYESFNNPDILFRFLDIHNVADCKKFSKKRIKNKFRDKYLLQSFCWTVLQNTFRLFIYLDRKEFQQNDDTELYKRIKFLTEELRKHLVNFDIYPHQIKLITTSKLQKELANQLTDTSVSYLENIRSVRTQLRQMVLTQELKKGFIYDVEFIGYEVKYNGAVKYKKAKTSRVKVFNETEAYFE